MWAESHTTYAQANSVTDGQGRRDDYAVPLQQCGERGVVACIERPEGLFDGLVDAPVLVHVKLAPMRVAVLKRNRHGAGGLRPAPSDLGLTVFHPVRQHDPARYSFLVTGFRIGSPRPVAMPSAWHFARRMFMSRSMLILV